MVDILILNYNDASTAIRLAEELRDYLFVDNILIVDNMSTDGSYSQLCEYSNTKVICIQTDRNGGYGYGNNFGIRYLKEKFNSEYILLCNPDIHVSDMAIGDMELFLNIHHECTVCAPLMMDVNGTIQHNSAFVIPDKKQYILGCGMIYRKLFYPRYHEEIEEWNQEFVYVDSVSGSLFMLRCDDFIKYCMYDEGLFLYGEELVLGLKLSKAGKKAAILPQHRFIHEHSVSIDKTFNTEKKKMKININSKLHIIKNYYNANRLELMVARVLSKISIAEMVAYRLSKGQK